MRGGLLDPNYLSDVTVQARGLTQEWRAMSEGIRSLLRGGSEEQLEQTRRELLGMQERLSSINMEFEELGGVPDSVSDALETSVRQLNDTLVSVSLRLREIQGIRAELNQDFIEQREFLDSLRAPEEDLEFRRRFFGTESGEPPTLEQISNLPFFRNRRRQQQGRQRQRAQAFAGFFEQGAESLYDQFIAPSILDAVGIGSGQTRARERAIEELTRSIEEARQEVRENELLNERQQQEEILEINREFEREKRQIQRQYEEERTDAWANWVRQQLTDFPKLIFQQLNLQLAARATNAVLNSLGIGGGVPITGPGIPGLGSIFGGGGGGAGGLNLGARFSQLGSTIGSGVGTAAGVGTVASFALAAHNVISGARAGLFDDIGMDIANLNPFGGGDGGGSTPVVVSSDAQLAINFQVNDQTTQTQMTRMGDLVSEGRAVNPFRRT